MLSDTHTEEDVKPSLSFAGSEATFVGGSNRHGHRGEEEEEEGGEEMEEDAKPIVPDGKVRVRVMYMGSRTCLSVYFLFFFYFAEEYATDELIRFCLVLVYVFGGVFLAISRVNLGVLAICPLSNWSWTRFLVLDDWVLGDRISISGWDYGNDGRCIEQR